jgi:hypothetical protein
MAKAAKPGREFALHWGSGFIEEEVQIETEHHRPTIQLLRFTEGAAKGTREIRFCHYDHKGRFQRSPLIIDEADLPALKAALATTPRLQAMLRRLVES